MTPPKPPPPDSLAPEDYWPAPQEPAGYTRWWIIIAGILAVLVALGWGMRTDWSKWFKTEGPTTPPISNKAAPPKTGVNGTVAVYESGPAQASASVPESAPSNDAPGMTDEERRELEALRNKTKMQEDALNRLSNQPKPAPGTEETAQQRKERLKREKEEREREQEKRERDLKAWKPLIGSVSATEKTEAQRQTWKTPTTPYSLAPGHLINCRTEGLLSNESPGSFRAMVTEGVRAQTGHIVIPQYTIMIGEPQGQAIAGDSRMTVAFDTIVLPNKNRIEFGPMKGMDRTGTGGFADLIDRHWGRLLASVLISGVLDSGSSIMAGGVGYASREDPAEAIGSSIASQTSREGQKQTRQVIKTEPTLQTRPSYGCSVMLRKELVIHAPYPL